MVFGHVANIAKRKNTLLMRFHSAKLLMVDTRTPPHLTVFSQPKYKRHRTQSLFSFFWFRVCAFPRRFFPEFPTPLAKFAVEVGDCIECNISPSYGKYETCVLERWSEINRPVSDWLVWSFV